ncbi:hypothetical protein Hamer_G011764 [Homarus americanus]|uniref:Uncharacterized protein n=1 Tax=Homarus americanus TaxID=6706 RepID=A0A8J5KBA1_HOMAM|nr:hypothetical protein Hamer_G011764 [Homarus americanus]
MGVAATVDLFDRMVEGQQRLRSLLQQEEVKEIAETVSSSEEEEEEEEGPPLAASAALHVSPAASAVNFFVKAWGNTTKATVRHAWSALLPQLKLAETKRQHPAELMNQVLETVHSIPAPGFQEVTREDLEEMMQEGNTNDVKDLLEDEEGGESGDAASDAGDTKQRKVTTQKLSLLLGVFTSLQEMIQDIDSESGEREQVIGVIESISRKYQTQYNERVNARQQSLITRFLSQRRPAEEDQQRELEVDENIDDIGEMPEDFDFARRRRRVVMAGAGQWRRRKGGGGQQAAAAA